MTIIEKLSDRHGFIFEAIKIVFVNNKEMISAKELQWQLFKAGVYINGSLLKQALSVMDDKGQLRKPEETKKEDAAIQNESKA